MGAVAVWREALDGCGQEKLPAAAADVEKAKHVREGANYNGYVVAGLCCISCSLPCCVFVFLYDLPLFLQQNLWSTSFNQVRQVCGGVSNWMNRRWGGSDPELEMQPVVKMCLQCGYFDVHIRGERTNTRDNFCSTWTPVITIVYIIMYGMS